jgi:hypothetical protein
MKVYLIRSLGIIEFRIEPYKFYKMIEEDYNKLLRIKLVLKY